MSISLSHPRERERVRERESVRGYHVSEPHTLVVDERDEYVDDNEGASAANACRTVDDDWARVLALFINSCLLQTDIL